MLWLVKELVTPSFSLSMSCKQSLWALYWRLGRSPNYCHRDSVQNEPKRQDDDCLDTLSDPKAVRWLVANPERIVVIR
jgi:hypothetical protein